MEVLVAMLVLWLTVFAHADPAPEAKAEPTPVPSLCLDGETVRFSCGLDKGKIVSLCAAGAAKTDRLHYRFGRPGAVELTFPGPEATDNSGFRARTVSHVQSQSLQVLFRIGDYEYTLVDQMTYGSERDHGAGVEVSTHGGGPWGEGKRVAWLGCIDDKGHFDIEGLQEARQ